MANKEKTISFKLSKGEKHAVLPLRDIVVFPHMIVPLFVGRVKSVHALESVMQKDQPLLLVTQKDSARDDPKTNELYCFGTLGNVLQLLKLPDGTVKVLVEGMGRARISSYDTEGDFIQAFVEPVSEEDLDPIEADAMKRTILGQFEQYIKLNSKVSPDVLSSVSSIEEPDKLADTIAAHLALKISEKQTLLEQVSVKARLEKVLSFMEAEISVLLTEKRLRSRVKRQMEKTQREYYLNEQMKAIQKELGEGDDGRSELDELEEKITKTKLTKEAKTKAKAELKKLRLMSPMSSEATVVRNYLDWLLSIPWKKRSRVKVDVEKAEKILDEDHFGLEKVKERILEYLAVQSRVGKVQGPILCLVGPPGVGKTSLAQSIARATGRKYSRMALGGVRDEAEIRGHRRTYIGSMPGKIIQGMRKAGSSNPLFLLDELDKLGSDWRGDPSSSLLEVLDPAQNIHFNDHYLEVDYDLSDVLFLTTANTMSRIPYPLQDRLEVIRLSGYTEDEKVEIAKRHLILKQCEMAGLKEGEWSIDDDALRKLIRNYTREAGVRNLQRELANLTRKAVKEILTHEKQKKISVTVDNLKDYAGVLRYRYGEAEKEDITGVTTGLAWTEVGGEILTIEAVMLPGKGKVTATGKLGEVMQESVQAATSYVRSRSVEFGVIPPLFEKKDIHVHVP
ncbi:MAG: endopeptidase La, partial [bacterium]|nr:endopeptidase La [bacterium]